MARARVDEVVVRRPDLRIPFPRRFRARLTGQTILEVTRRAKYLIAPLSSGETLLMHLGMSGSFRVEPDDDPREALNAKVPEGDERHDHVVFRMSSGFLVHFNDPRRFGFMDLIAKGRLASHPVLSGLGLEPLSAEFDAAALARACHGRKVALKVALLDQRVASGLGNIYVSEALNLAGLSPMRLASTIATPKGLPRPTAARLTTAIKQVLTDAVTRVASYGYRASRFRVYDKEGQPCPTEGCTGAIKRRTQAGRSTFYCSVCQH